MENNNQRALCQQLWAGKISTLFWAIPVIFTGHSYYLKQVVELVKFRDDCRALPDSEHRVRFNAFQHIRAILKSKLVLMRQLYALAGSLSLCQAPRKTWTRDCLKTSHPEMLICKILPCWKETPMRLWHGWFLTSVLALGNAHRECAPAWLWLGLESMRRLTMSLPSPYHLYTIIAWSWRDGWPVASSQCQIKWLDKNYRGKTCPLMKTLPLRRN